jgi:hypothetical protein
MARGRRTGGAYRTARERMFALYGDVCHICGHAGADSADHLIPLAADPRQLTDATLMRPAHHNACPTCGVRCNGKRGAKPMDVVRTEMNESPTSRDW